MSDNQSVDGSMTFLEHLGELRTRLIRFLIVFSVCVLACYAVRKELLDIVKSPVEVPLQKYSTGQLQTVHENVEPLNLNHYTCQCQPISPQPFVQKESLEQSVETVSKEKVESQPSFWVKVKNITFSFLDIPISGKTVKKISPNSQSPEKLSCQCTPNTSVATTNHKTPMVYLGLPELFFTQMKTAIFAGLFLAFPFLIIQIWGFVGPALFKSEKKVFWCFSISTYICFIGGALFGYFVVFPFGFDFFLSLTEPGEIVPSLSIGQYLSLAIKLLISFGVIFELPLMTFILARLGLLTPRAMIQHSRMAFLVICVLSALLTPPDPFTMLLMAAPLIVLYMISIFVCFVGQNKQKAALKEQGVEE